MSIGILGNKLGMAQLFDAQGNAIPVTIVKAGPCFVTQIKRVENCGYSAIQLGYNATHVNAKKLTKPLLGHFFKQNLQPYSFVREYRVNNLGDFSIGQELSLDLFRVGEKINVSGLTIGKGNASNLKRNNFKRGPMSHGSKHHRLQGSLGAGTSPGRVFPGKKMPGRLGFENRTIKNLEILGLNLKENILFIKGNVPGKVGNLLKLTSTN